MSAEYQHLASNWDEEEHLMSTPLRIVEWISPVMRSPKGAGLTGGQRLVIFVLFVITDISGLLYGFWF